MYNFSIVELIIGQIFFTPFRFADLSNFIERKMLRDGSKYCL